MKTIALLLITCAVCLAPAGTALAAPSDATPPVPEGQALSPEIVPGAGLSGVAGVQTTIHHLVIGTGATAAGAFRIDIGRGTSAKVAYADPLRGLRFQALQVGSIRFVENTATLRGIGLLNDRRVGFVVVAVHNATPGVDTFRIAWQHGSTHGGRVVSGSVFIR
jgi:hypothetical protein